MSVRGGWKGFPAQPRRPLNCLPLNVNVGRIENLRFMAPPLSAGSNRGGFSHARRVPRRYAAQAALAAFEARRPLLAESRESLPEVTAREGAGFERAHLVERGGVDTARDQVERTFVALDR